MLYDPFLFDHEVAPRQYELSNGIQPVSIRDQIIRGTEIVARLVACGVVPRDTGQLLVVGGGVVGFSAALEAVTQGVTVTLLEADTTYFSLFDQCTSRRVDPTFYDWPLLNWRAHTFNSPTPPLAFSPGSIATAVKVWRNLIKTTNKVHFEVRTGTTFVPKDITLQNDKIHYKPTSLLIPEIYDAILYAAGMGTERVWLNDSIDLPKQYCGPKFWQTDQLSQRWCGKPNQPAVLIAGSGDGALQDYIRILTGLHPAEVLEKIDDELNGKAEWQDAQYRLLASQDKAARQYALGCKSKFHKERDKAIEAELHKAFKMEIETLFCSCGSNIKTVIDSIVKARKADLPHTLHLLISNEAFTWCYAANRFLVLLLSEYLQMKYHSDDTFLGHTLLYGHELRSTDMNGNEVEAISVKKRTRTLLQYDLVIIRFGLKRPVSLCPSGKSPRQRSMMPSHFITLSS